MTDQSVNSDTQSTRTQPSQDRFISPEKPPEELERELLTVLSEECAEVSQRVCKALRFGMAEVQPGHPNSNADRIADELGDLLGVLDQLERLGSIDRRRVEAACETKLYKLRKYLQSTT